MSVIKIVSHIPIIGLLVRKVLSIANYKIIPAFYRNKFEHLLHLRNKYEGRRCFIVATGPSLKISDLEKLKGEICLSCNSIVKILDKTSWRPDYYFMYDKDAFLRIKEDIVASEKNLYNFYHPYEWPYSSPISRPYVLKHKSWYTENQQKMLVKLGLDELGFSKDIHDHLEVGGNVVHVMMQFALYMGFNEIYLLGCDCSYLKDQTHAEGISYNMPSSYDAERSARVVKADYELEKKVLESEGVKVFNATRGGYLELFPRVSLEEIIGK